MAKNFTGNYECKEDGVNVIIGEHNNTYTALREIRWFEDSDFKLDLRKYKTDETNDIPLKGISITEEEGDELALALIKEGYGDDEELTNVILDHRPGLVHCLGSEGYDQNPEDARKKRLFIRADGEESQDEETEDKDYYDPKGVIS